MDWNEIVKDFKNGYSVLRLTKKYNVSYRKINNYLINNKIKYVKHTKLSESMIEECIQMINNECTIGEIKTKLSLSTETIHNIASENNLMISVFVNPRMEKNKNFRDDYFENINTETKAYFLGLIYADGNVREHNGGYYLNIELKREDKYILEMLASELKCGNSIYDRDRITNFGQGHTSSFTSCNSKKMFDDLSRFNIVPDKSHATTSFKNIERLIPQDLIKHFLRGLIDGDGTISKRFTTNQNAIAIYQNEIEFCYEFDRFLKKIMNDNTLFANIIMNKNNGVYSLRYRRINDVIKICDFLYRDAIIYLNRKYELAKLYFNSFQESNSFSSLVAS